MTPRPTARSLLARRFDPAELREIKRLWVRHSIAEDARDIDGLVATLAPNCAYELIPTGQRWDGHDGARAFYTELFAAFPDNRFELTDIVVGPQGVFEAARLTGTNLGPWAGRVRVRAADRPGGADPLPVGPGDAAVPRRESLVRSRINPGAGLKNPRPLPSIRARAAGEPPSRAASATPRHTGRGILR